MTNEYYSPPAAIPYGIRAKSSDINAIIDTLDDGFDNLPTDLSGLKTEVIAARDGLASLLAKEQAQDSAHSLVSAEVIAARDGLASLLVKQQAQDAATVAAQAAADSGVSKADTAQAEITAARAGLGSLLLKQQAQDTAISTAQTTASSGVTKADTAQAEIVAARAGQVSLVVKQQAQDTAISTAQTKADDAQTEVTAARDGLASLLAKEQAQDTAHDSIASEIIAARDGLTSLLAKEQAQDTAIAATVAGSGVLVSNTDTTIGFLIGKLLAGQSVTLTKGNDGGNETLTISVATELVNDSTPQLGGNLDVNGKTIPGLGAAAVGSYGTAAETICEGNDTRLSNARTPTAHNNTYHSVSFLVATNYATSTVGGTVKARLNGTTAYFTINGATA